MNEYNRSPSPAPSYPAPSYVIDDSFAPQPEAERQADGVMNRLERPRKVLTEHWRELSVGAALIALSSWMLALQLQFSAFLPWCDDVADG